MLFSICIKKISKQFAPSKAQIYQLVAFFLTAMFRQQCCQWWWWARRSCWWWWDRWRSCWRWWWWWSWMSVRSKQVPSWLANNSWCPIHRYTVHCTLCTIHRPVHCSSSAVLFPLHCITITGSAVQCLWMQCVRCSASEDVLVQCSFHNTMQSGEF